MPSATATRRLAAILAADVVGYSRLMGADEEGTLARLKIHLREIVEPTIREHRGRIVKTTGDGLLAEFGSVVDAVRSAAAVQCAMAERNAAVAAGERIAFRIGVNVGDIMVEDGDIFGDGVNIAARLEGLADPGGVCVSARVHEDAAGRLDLAFRDLGEQRLRNIERPIRVYALSPAASLPAPAGLAPAVPTESPTAPRLSIVVLPFANLSNDPEQDYFVDTLTDDLTTDLSRIEDMVVISRSTAFTYRGRPVNAKEIGRELGVRYVLEGSVRRLGPRIRVNAQLIEQLAEEALAAAPASPIAHLAKGQVLRVQQRYEDAISEYEAALAANRNWVFAIYNLGQCKLFTGAIEEVIPLQEQAIRLSPRDRLVAFFYFEIGRVHLLEGRTDEAVLWLERARSANPVSPFPHAYIAAAYALRGEAGRAAGELAEARKCCSDARFSSLERLKATHYFGVPKIRALHEATYFAGLRLAGMPEE